MRRPERRDDDYRRDAPRAGMTAPSRYFDDPNSQENDRRRRKQEKRDRRRTQESSQSGSLPTQNLTQHLGMSQESYTAFDDLAQGLMGHVFSSQSQSQGYSQSQDFPGSIGKNFRSVASNASPPPSSHTHARTFDNHAARWQRRQVSRSFFILVIFISQRSTVYKFLFGS